MLVDRQSQEAERSAVGTFDSLCFRVLGKACMHANAARRTETQKNVLGITALISSVLTSSALFLCLRGLWPDAFKWVAALLGFISASSTGLMAFMKSAERAAGHRLLEKRYAAYLDSCEWAVKQHETGMINREAFRETLSKHLQELKEIDHAAAEYPLSLRDKVGCEKSLSKSHMGA